jgi:hypothetical protein
MAVNDISQYFKLGDGTAIQNDSQFTSMSADTKIVNTESGDTFKKVSGFSNVFDRVESHGDAVTYSAQTGFTNEQKAQARANIGAMSSSESFGKSLQVDSDYLYLWDQHNYVLSKLSWNDFFDSYDGGNQQGYFKIGRLKIQYFMAPPNEEFTYPYGGYNSTPVAFVSRCTGYDSSNIETYCSDYIGIVNAGSNGCYLSWTQDNHDDYYPILVIGLDDGTTSEQPSSETVVSGTWYYVSTSPTAPSSTTLIPSSSIWKQFTENSDSGGYNGNGYGNTTTYTGSGSHPSDGSYKAKWSRKRPGSNYLYKATGITKVA